MILDKENFEQWMQRIMERFDKLENRMMKPEKPSYSIDGEKLMDNQDLCLMLNCSKRTLQRYRVSGMLPCKRINQKTYYLESDVMNFVREYLQKPDGQKGK